MFNMVFRRSYTPVLIYFLMREAESSDMHTVQSGMMDVTRAVIERLPQRIFQSRTLTALYRAYANVKDLLRKSSHSRYLIGAAVALPIALELTVDEAASGPLFLLVAGRQTAATVYQVGHLLF